MAYTRGGKAGKGIRLKSGEPLPEKYRSKEKLPLHRGTGPDFEHVTGRSDHLPPPKKPPIRGSVEATAPNPFGGGRAEIGEMNFYHRGDRRNELEKRWKIPPKLSFRRTDLQGPKVVPPHVDVQDMPPEDMEFYRTGAPDRPEGIRGTGDRPVLVDPVFGEVIDDKPILKTQPPEVGDYEGIVIEKEETEIPEETSVVNKIKELALNWGGILDWPSLIGLKKTSKQLAGSVKNQIKTAFKDGRLGPDKLSAKENVEIDEIIFYMKKYPEVWDAIVKTRQGENRQFNEMSDVDIVRHLKAMEQEGTTSLGGRSIIKIKRKRKRNGYSKTWNY